MKEMENIVKIMKKKLDSEEIKQEYPMRLTLLTIFILDMKEMLRKGQAKNILVRKEKVWLLVYVDSIILMVDRVKERKKMIMILEKYLINKKLFLNIEKYEIMVLEKGDKKEKEKEGG